MTRFHSLNNRARKRPRQIGALARWKEYLVVPCSAKKKKYAEEQCAILSQKLGV